LRNANSAVIINFLYKNIITKHGVFNKLINNDGLKNKKLIKNLITLYNISQVVISFYNPRINNLIKKIIVLLLTAFLK